MLFLWFRTDHCVLATSGMQADAVALRKVLHYRATMYKHDHHKVFWSIIFCSRKTHSFLRISLLLLSLSSYPIRSISNDFSLITLSTCVAVSMLKVSIQQCSFIINFFYFQGLAKFMVTMLLVLLKKSPTDALVLPCSSSRHCWTIKYLHSLLCFDVPFPWDPQRNCASFKISIIPMIPR